MLTRSQKKYKQEVDAYIRNTYVGDFSGLSTIEPYQFAYCQNYTFDKFYYSFVK